MDTQAIAFQYPCYICKEVLFTPTDIMSHVICQHGFMLHQRLEASLVIGGDIRPPEKNYEYKEFPLPKEETDFIVIHSACPSCWYHCAVEDFDEFKGHIKKAHDPQHYMPSYNSQAENRGNGESSGNGREHDEIKTEQATTEPTLEDVINIIQELKGLFHSYFLGTYEEEQ